MFFWSRRAQSEQAADAGAVETGTEAPVVTWESLAAALTAIGNRDFIRERGTREQRIQFHQMARLRKAEEIEQRTAMGRMYTRLFRRLPGNRNIHIDEASGFTTKNLSHTRQMQRVLKEARAIMKAKEDENHLSKGSITFFASAKKDFDNNSEIAKFARSPTVLLPIIEYFKMMPILFGFDINRADSNELLNWSSHYHHLDPEDTMQIKVFVYLVDVDEETRPFTALPAYLSQRVANKLNYTVGRLTDEQVAKVVGPNQEKAFVGPAGTIVFCDTNRCFHFGGRPGKYIRDVLVLYYSLPTSTWFPLDENDGVARNLTPLLRPRKWNPFDRLVVGHE